MVCPADTRGEELTDEEWRNWAGLLRFRPRRTFRPATLRELVAAVVFAEREGQRIRAVGSSWSYSEAAVSRNVDVVVETHLLKEVLNDSDSPDIVPGALNPAARTIASLLLHVQAGIKIDELNCLLDQRGLAMPTLGGERGQSLAGVISTGTHGSDLHLPPIADAVRAIHLVGPGGREWWIERQGSRAITVPASMESLRAAGALCSDLNLVYDDRTFNAVLVSVGRMGIVYAYVLEAVAAFPLRETREPQLWSVIEPVLRTPRTIDAPVAALAGSGSARFIEIVISPFRNGTGDLDCVITRRFVANPADPIVPRGDDSASPFAMLCRAQDIGAIARPMLPLIDIAALSAFGFLLAIPFVGGPLFALATTGYVALRVALQALVDAAASGANLGELFARVCTLAARVGQSWIVGDLVGLIVQQLRGPLPGGFVLDQSFKVSTPQQDCERFGVESPACMREIDGFEFAFNAGPNQSAYLDFINELSGLVNSLLTQNRPVGLALSLRYTRASEALIAMQRFSTTCSIEVMLLRGLPGNAEFVPQMEALAYRHGGIPHWGLLHSASASQIRSFYGENLGTWKRVLARLIDEGPGARPLTFSTNFSMARELEPPFGCLVPRPLFELLVRVIEALARRR